MAYTDQDYAVVHELVFAGIHPFSMTYALQSSEALPPTPGAIAVEAHNAFDAELLPMMTDFVVLNTTRVKRLLDNVDGVLNAPVQGSFGTGNSVPNNVARVVSLHTAQPGRSGRGRMYFGGSSTAMFSATDPNVLDGAHITALGLAVTNFQDALNGLITSLVLAVWSRTLVELNVVTSTSIDNLVDTQRRRVRD